MTGIPECKADSKVNRVITQESGVNGLHAALALEGRNSEEKDVFLQFPSLVSILESHNEIKVHQHLDFLEVCLGWERNNRYSLFDKDDNQILYTYEAAQCYARQCYGSLRELVLITTDNDDNRLLNLIRPLRCSSRLCYACCCLQEMTIKIQPDQMLGGVKERWTCCTPEYVVVDALEKTKFTLHGSSLHFRCCCDIVFSVREISGVQVARIHKQWGGCKDIIGANNNFIIEYIGELSGEDKATILGASFLLDFNYFERHGKCF